MRLSDFNPLLFFVTALVGKGVAVCPAGYSVWLPGGICFERHRGPVKNLIAECNNKYFSIHSLEENAHYQEILSFKSTQWENQIDNLTLPVTCDPTTGIKSWFNDENMDFYNFAHGYPCSEFYVMFHGDGKWYPVNDDQVANGACRHPHPTSSTPCGEEFQEEPLLSNPKNCVRLYIQDEDHATWSQAEANCKADQAQLLSIHDAKENKMFADYCGIFGLGMVHLGLTNMEGSDIWQDGESIGEKGFRNFLTGHPNSRMFGPCTSFNCTANNGSWISSTCGVEKQPYFCMKAALKPNGKKDCKRHEYNFESASIFSPTFPLQGDEEVECQYTMTRVGLGKPTVRVLELEVPECCGILKLSDDHTSRVVRLRGSLQDFSFAGEGNTVSMVYKAKNARGTKGFSAQFSTEK